MNGATSSSGGFTRLVFVLAVGMVIAVVVGIVPEFRKGMEEGIALRAAVSLARCDRLLEERALAGAEAARPRVLADFDRAFFDKGEAPLDWPRGTLFETFDASGSNATVRVFVGGRERLVRGADVPRDRVF